MCDAVCDLMLLTYHSPSLCGEDFNLKIFMNLTINSEKAVWPQLGFFKRGLFFFRGLDNTTIRKAHPVPPRISSKSTVSSLRQLEGKIEAFTKFPVNRSRLKDSSGIGFHQFIKDPEGIDKEPPYLQDRQNTPCSAYRPRSARLSKKATCLLHLFTSSIVSRRRKPSVAGHVFVLKVFFCPGESGIMSALRMGHRPIVGIGRLVSSGGKATAFSGGHFFRYFSSLSKFIAGICSGPIREKNCGRDMMVPISCRKRSRSNTIRGMLRRRRRNNEQLWVDNLRANKFCIHGKIFEQE